MPDQKYTERHSNRIQVPLSNEAREAVELLAEVKGISLAKTCQQLLEELTPVIISMANALEVAKTAPAKAMREMVDITEQQLADLDQLKLDMEPKDVKRRKG